MNRGKRQKAAPPSDFVPEWDGRRRKTPEELFQVVQQMNQAMGGTVRGAGV